MQKIKREKYIDLLKGLAILGVVLVHYNEKWNSPLLFLDKASMIGARCPQLFFVISAFLAWNSIVSSKDYSVISYMEKKIIRLAPLYYIAIIVAVFIPINKNANFTIFNYISHFVFLNGFNPKWINCILGIEWYIADLMILYLITFLLKKYIINLTKACIALVVSVCFSSAVLILFNYIWGDKITIDPIYESYYHTFLFVHQLPVWITGIVVYYLVIYIKNEKKYKNVILGVYGSLVVIATLCFLFANLNKRFLSSSIVAGLIFGWILLFASTISFNDFFLIEFISNIGKRSYGIFCFHEVIINCFFALFSSVNNSFIRWGIVLMFVITVSIIIGGLTDYLGGYISQYMLHKFVYKDNK